MVGFLPSTFHYVTDTCINDLVGRVKERGLGFATTNSKMIKFTRKSTQPTYCFTLQNQSFLPFTNVKFLVFSLAQVAVKRKHKWTSYRLYPANRLLKILKHGSTWDSHRKCLLRLYFSNMYVQSVWTMVGYVI